MHDNGDGTYNVSVSLIKIAATVRVVINMDKNIPAAGGELPYVQLTFQPSPSANAPAAAQAFQSIHAWADNLRPPPAPADGSDIVILDEEGASSSMGATPAERGFFKGAIQEVLTGMGVDDPELKPKDPALMAVEAFQEAGAKAKQRRGLDRQGKKRLGRRSEDIALAAKITLGLAEEGQDGASGRQYGQRCDRESRDGDREHREQ